jgi:hypothetical protein
MDLTLRRGSVEMPVKAVTRWVETADGEPLRMEQELGPNRTTWIFGPEAVEARSEQGGRTRTETLPRPPPGWLTPSRAERHTREALAAGHETIRFATLDPNLGLNPVTLELERLGPGEPMAGPKGKVPTTRWRQKASGVESIVHIDANGEALRSETTLLGTAMVMVRTDRPGAEGERAAPELFVSSFVRPNRPLEAPRDLVRAVYRVRDRQGKLAALPHTAGQRATRDGEGYRVEVSTGSFGPEPLAEAALYLQPSAFLDFESPVMRPLAAKALEGVSEVPAERAEALRRFVRGHILRYDLRTGFATASQVAEQRSGDCTESAVLLAALLRAGGIPSRVVTGLLYIESFEGQSHVFGYHMWAQAHLGGRWVDLDAITPEPFDAAHIALAVSALDQPQGLSTPENLAPLAVSELVIEVVETIRGD